MLVLLLSRFKSSDGIVPHLYVIRMNNGFSKTFSKKEEVFQQLAIIVIGGI